MGVGQVTITPDKARELLNTARQEAGDGQRPVTVAAKYAPLAEAAYALAQTVANLHYEYAVQVQLPPLTSYDTPTWEPLEIRGLPSVFATLQGAQNLASERVAPTRIVRRLVSAPEVVE